MPATPPLPPLKRVPPGVWTALAWCTTTVYACVVLIRWPGEASGYRPGSGLDWPVRAWVYLAVATALALGGSWLLRRRPLPAVALLLAGAVFGAVTLNSTAIGFLQFPAVDVALCFVAAGRPRRTSIAATALALGVPVAYMVTRLLLGFPIGTPTQLAVTLTAVIAWLVGRSTRQGHEHAEALRERATEQAVTAERLRIARELHDMVAHGIGVVALQAGAAHRVFDTRPDLAREALREVETAGRETLSGLRRMLGALREAEPVRWDGQSDGRGRGPAPGLADIERLAEATTAAGVRVELCWQGERRQLPPEVDLSAYRIVQEAVTNVLRHAGADSCRVSVDCGDEELSIEVLDQGDGRAPAPGAGGYGLVGLRERVALLHGEFSAAPRPGGGFRVAARLPVPAGARR